LSLFSPPNPKLKKLKVSRGGILGAYTVIIIQTVKSWDAFSTFKSPKIRSFVTKNLSPGIGGAPSQKLYLKNGTLESIFKWWGWIPHGQIT
jgi:hypothetical protein